MVNVSARIFLDRIGCRVVPRVFWLGGLQGVQISTARWKTASEATGPMTVGRASRGRANPQQNRRFVWRKRTQSSSVGSPK